MLIYTGIGSRTTPIGVLEIMQSVAYQLSDRWLLRSGHADGADRSFELGVLQHALANDTKPKMEIYLPWSGFNGATVGPHFLFREPTEKVIEIAAKFHPAWDRCTPAAKFMHIRNVYQIAGFDLNTPTRMVICWTPQGKRGGGTGQALRIAEYLNIPIFDLAVPGADMKLAAFVEEETEDE